MAEGRSFTLKEYPTLRLLEMCEKADASRGYLDMWMMLREIGPGENGFGNDGYGVPLCRFGEYLQSRLDMRSGSGLRPGCVPMTTFWLYDRSRPIAVSKLRHRLNESLRKVGGHVGYCVRPSERGKGYGTHLLALTLVAARKQGMRRLLITCNSDNTPSRRVIARNGGSLDRIAEGICYYWVGTDQRK